MKEIKIDFQDSGHGGHLGLLIGTILALFNWSIGLFVQEKKRKTDFQDGRQGGHFGFLIETSFATFDLQITPMLPTEFQVNWPFGSGVEAKNRISRWPPRRSSWISDRNNFSFFDIQVTPCFLPSFKSVGLLVQEKKRKIDFQDSRHSGHFGFQNGTI